MYCLSEETDGSCRKRQTQGIDRADTDSDRIIDSTTVTVGESFPGMSGHLSGMDLLSCNKHPKTEQNQCPSLHQVARPSLNTSPDWYVG